ncbi:DNA polymerase III subunit beta [Microcoleus sp. herbarium7]|uniref:DNA polymerase III subunit beta n=1 Tax=Microcoleus sp. herbarium7 TaxID=3055435 RepID=UPI002FD0A0BB
MKFTCDQSVLSENLALVNRAVPSRATHPVLTCILVSVEASQDAISLTSFDLSLGVNVTFTANVERGGVAAIPAKLLSEIVSKLPKGEVTLEDDEDSIISLTSSSGTYRVRCMNAEEFPRLPEIVDGTQVTLNPTELRSGLQNTLFAAATDEAKQVLNGVHFAISETILEFASTDGHRLAMVTMASEDVTDVSLNVTVPLKALVEVEKILHKTTNPVRISFSEEQLVLTVNEPNQSRKRITTRTLAGAYPNYHVLIPPTFERKIIVDRRLLLSTIERISVYSTKPTDACKCIISTDAQELILSIDAKETGDCKEAIPAQVSGESLEMAFNIKYLLDILRVATLSELEICVNGALTPVVFKPVGDVTTSFLVMPVQLRS